MYKIYLLQFLFFLFLFFTAGVAVESVVVEHTVEAGTGMRAQEKGKECAARAVDLRSPSPTSPTNLR